MRLAAAGILAFSIGGLLPSAIAGPSPALSAAAAAPAPNCPDKRALRGICTSVYDKTRADEATGYRYEFERQMYEAACADNKEDPQVSRIKIQKLWRENQGLLRCNTTNFDVAEGSVLKYAVSTRSYNIAYKAVTKWGLDLNIVDPSDNRTLLDYVEGQIKANSDPPNDSLPQLKDLRELLLKHGAKRRSELN